MHYTLILLFFILPFSASAQLNPQTVSIPMTDGEVLAGDLYLPNETDQFPTILIQTPYNKNAFLLTGLPFGINYDITTSDYAFLIVDWRCYFGSASACSLDASGGEDGYDVVEWIAEQPWSDGKVGTWGASALGTVQFQTAREQPPHLVCSVPIVVSPQAHYEKYFPGGSARVDYFDFVGTYFGFGNLLANNPYYNLIWTIAENGSMYPAEIEVPMLIIGGWFDHNTDDCLTMYDTLRSTSPADVQDNHRLLMGPWTHNRVGNPVQGDLSFPEAADWQDSLALQFFDYHLRGINNNWENSPGIQYFQMGANTWEETDFWPPEGMLEQTLFLQEDQSMHPQMTFVGEEAFSYEYDPTDPSPSIGGKIFSLQLLQNDVGPIDQAPVVESREDHVTFTTLPLSEAISVQGKIKAKLFFSSDRIDTDVALRLTDVYPDGRSIIMGESILRMHVRNGLSVADTAYMEPGTIYEVELEFENLAHTFLAGHQIRLIITSSNYPRYNRNMNTGGPMYPNANIDTLVNPLVATNTVHVGQLYPSSIILPVTETIVGSREVIPSFDLKVYPVPASEEVYLQDLPAWKSMQLFDAKGRMVWENNAGGESGDFQLKVNDFESGIYLLKVVSEEGELGTARVIKIRG